MSEINASNFKKEHGDLAPDLVGVTELTSPYFFVPPSGDTAERPEDCEPGTLRFNTDHGSLEIFRGKTIGWEQIQRRESQYLGGGQDLILELVIVHYLEIRSLHIRYNLLLSLLLEPLLILVI